METLNGRNGKIALYDRLVALHPDAVRKGDTMPYTSLNGNMYSYFTKDDYLAPKLSAEKREEFIEKYNTGLVLQYGIVQKEYVQVPDAFLKNIEELKTWFFDSYSYATTLKPKPTTKGKKKEYAIKFYLLYKSANLSSNYKSRLLPNIYEKSIYVYAHCLVIRCNGTRTKENSCT